MPPLFLCKHARWTKPSFCSASVPPLFCYAWLWKPTLVLGLYRCFVCIKSQGPQALWLGDAILQAIFSFFFFALRVHSPSKGAVYNLMLCVQYGVWFCLCVSCPAVPFFFCLFCFVNVEAKLYFLSLYMVLGAFVGQRNRSSWAPNAAFSRIAVGHGYSVTFPTFGRGSFVSMPCLF